MLLQATRRSDKGPGGAEPGHEVRDPAVRLLEDLHRRPFVVRARIRGIRVLIRIEVIVRIRRHDFAHHADGAIRALARIAVQDLGAIGGHESLALGAYVAWHHKLHAVALGRPDQRIRDARVA